MTNSIQKIGRVSSESVKKHTKRSWDQWIALLDNTGAKNWPHREITLLLKTKYKLSPWWQQGVAIGFEIHHGLRIEGRSEKGTYGTVASKTFPLSAKKAWALVSKDPGLSIWLRPFTAFEWKKGKGFEVDGGIFGEVRTVKPGQRIRLSWQEENWKKPSVLQLQIVPREGEKCMIVLQHEGLPNNLARTKLRDHWKAALNELRNAVR